MPRRNQTANTPVNVSANYWEDALKKLGLLSPITLEVTASLNTQPSAPSAQLPAPDIDPFDFEMFLRNINRGAQKRGLPSDYPTTLKEFMALPKEERDQYIQAYRMYKGQSPET